MAIGTLSDIDNSKFTVDEQFKSVLRTDRSERIRGYKVIEEKARVNHHDKKIPYCTFCAREEFRDEQERMWKKSGHRQGIMRPEDQPLDHFNYDIYGKSKHFVLKKEHTYFDKVIINGRSRSVPDGVWREFECKERFAKVAIHLNSDWLAEHGAQEKPKGRGRPKKDKE